MNFRRVVFSTVLWVCLTFVKGLFRCLCNGFRMVCSRVVLRTTFFYIVFRVVLRFVYGCFKCLFYGFVDGVLNVFPLFLKVFPSFVLHV